MNVFSRQPQTKTLADADLCVEPPLPENLDRKRSPSRRLVFGIVAIALFMSSADTTIVATALPAIQSSLHSSINWAGWTITIYALGMVVALPTAGKLSDQFGRRRIFLLGTALFTFSSLVCAFTGNIYMLVAFRAIQALGGGALNPSAAGLVADHFGKDRDRGIGMFGTIAASGQIAGPIFGGLFVSYLSWRWIFFFNIPTGIVLLFLTYRFIPESALGERRRIDLRGLLYSAAFILTAIFGIANLGSPTTRVGDPIFVVPEIAAIVFLILFVRHTRRDPDPFIPVRLLRAHGFAAVNLQNFCWGMTGFGIASLVPLFAEDRYHLHALNAATLLTARALGMVAIGTLAALALRRTGYRWPMRCGFTVVACGTLLMATAPHFGLSPYFWLSIGAGLAGLGNGIANPASRNACLQLAPDEAATVSGLRMMFSFTGIIFSVSIATAILNRSHNLVSSQEHILWAAAAILMLVMLPLTWAIPEHKGSW